MLKKRYVLALLGVSILLAGSLVYAQNPPKKVYKWKVVIVYPANIPIFNNGIEKFVNDVKAESNGKLDIKFYAAREHIEDIKKSIEPGGVFDAVSNGTVEMGFGATAYWAQKVPACEFMFAIPFGLNSEGMYAWLYQGGGLELWRELFEPYNVLPFPMGNAGNAMAGWFDKKIEKISDFKGMNIRMLGFCSRIYQKLKANERWMVAGEALDAYEKGQINAIVCQGPYHDKFHKFYKALKYYYYPGWQEPGGILSLIVNKKAWDKLPPHLQKTIETVCGNTYNFIYTQFQTMNARALKELQNKEKVKLMEFPQEVLDQLEQLSREVLEEEAKNDPQFKRVYEAFKKFKEENKAYGWRGNLYGTAGK